MKKIITYSAPAKVILSGEHAVIFNKPALALALALRLNFSLLNAGSKRKNNTNIDFISKTVKNYLKSQKKKILSNRDLYQYVIKSSIPIKRGLGSSAALSVAASATFLEYYSGETYPNEIVNNLSYKIEKRFHDNPSGVDNSACCFGGLIYFRKEFNFLKNISQLNFIIPKKIEEKLYLIDSGPPLEKTSEMINLVADFYRRHPKKAADIFNDIEKTTRRFVVSIIKEDEHLFAESLKNNNVLLNKLGIISARTQNLLLDLNKFGVGKVTGAGGRSENSGFILFFAFDESRLIHYLMLNKINYFKFKQSVEGLKKEP